MLSSKLTIITSSIDDAKCRFFPNGLNANSTDCSLEGIDVSVLLVASSSQIYQKLTINKRFRKGDLNTRDV